MEKFIFNLTLIDGINQTVNYLVIVKNIELIFHYTEKGMYLYVINYLFIVLLLVDVFSCESSYISPNVRPSVCLSVRLSVTTSFIAYNSIN